MNKAKLLQTLRILAVAGVCLTAQKHLLSATALEPRQEYSYYALLYLLLAVGAVFALLHESARALFKNSDLLVPLGLYVGIGEIIGFLGVSPIYFTNFDELRLAAQSVGGAAAIALFCVLHVLNGVVFVGWTTRAIVQMQRGNAVDLLAAFADFKFWFWRAAATIFVFAVVPTAVLLSFTGLRVRNGDLIFLVAAVAISTLLINFSSYAVLPVVLSEREPLGKSIRRGIVASCKNLRKTAIPIVLQMLILGWLVAVSASCTKIETDYKISEFGAQQYDSASEKIVAKSSYATHLFWIGGFRETSDWHKDWLKAIEAKPLPVADFRIGLLMLLLGILVKIHVVKTVFGGSATTTLCSPTANKTLLFGRTPILLMCAATCFVPIELIAIGAAKQREYAESDLAKFAAPKIYSGETFFAQSVFFKIGQHNTFAYQNPDQSADAFGVGRIVDVAVLGAQRDVAIAGSQNALILDNNGALKKKVAYQMGESDEERPTNVYFKTVRAIDIENDGKYEFVGVGTSPSSGFILDENGAVVLRHSALKDRFSLEDFVVRDVDGDGKKEIVADEQKLISFLDLNGKLLWSQPIPHASFGDKAALADVDGDGKDEILHGGLSGSIRKLKEDRAALIKKPHRQHAFLIEPNEAPLILFFNRNKLGLFDFKNQLKSLYEAPLSQIADTRISKTDEDLFRGANFVDAFEARAVKVKLKIGEPKFLAVLLRLMTKTPDYSVSMLYVYDGGGALVYQESIKDAGDVLKAFPTGDETESLLIADGETIKLYKAN